MLSLDHGKLEELTSLSIPYHVRKEYDETFLFTNGQILKITMPCFEIVQKDSHQNTKKLSNSVKKVINADQMYRLLNEYHLLGWVDFALD